MADISGGSLSFSASLDNSQLNTAINETLRRVQGVSDAVVGMGDTMDSTTAEMVESIRIQNNVIRQLEASVAELDAKIASIEPGEAQEILIAQAEAARQELDLERQGLVELTAQLQSMQAVNTGTALTMEQIRNTLSDIGAACEIHETALNSLETQYQELGQKMGQAFRQGRDEEYNALKERQQEISGEIRVRKSLLNELRQQSNVLEDEASKLAEAAQAAKKAGNEHVLLRTRIRNLREEMAALVADGISEQSAEYKKLADELGRLTDLQGDINAQGKILANDEQNFAGIISGISGVAGAFSAAQGAVALFSGENENLQRIILKVQSLMSITMGLQQAAQALNKDSAFMLVTVNKAKEWWNRLLAIGRGEQIAATAATVADTAAEVANTAATQANSAAQGQNTSAQRGNTVAKGASVVATNAATVANITLAGAFRMLGAAIKSVPVVGWIIAGVSALIGVITHFVRKSKEAEKAQKEWYQSIADNAYKPIAKIEELSTKWNALGDDLEAKKRFIEENRKAFEELGVAVNGVTEAENLLSKNKQAFIDAQIDKAKAMLLVQQAQDKVKTLAAKELEYEKMPDKVTKYYSRGQYGGVGTYETENKDKIKLKEEIENLKTEYYNLFTEGNKAQNEAVNKLKEAGIEVVGEYEAGMLGAIEQSIQAQQALFKKASTHEEFAAIQAEINKLQKQANAITGKKDSSPETKKDPFIEKLDKYKTEYQRFMKWINSGDKILVKSANQEFEGLLKEGATYIDYLKNQRDQILSIDKSKRSKAQNKQLGQLNDAIAEETKQTALDAFNSELAGQLSNAKSVLEMLDIIEQKRKSLKNDGTELDNAQAASLDAEEEKAKQQLQSDTDALLEEYASCVEKKRKLEEEFNRDIALLELQRTKATTDEEIAAVDAAIKNRTQKYQQDTKGSGNADYDAMLADFGTFEQRKQAIIDEYEEKRKIAQEQGNEEMVEAINKAQSQALSGLALDELQAHPDWALMFGDLDEISTEKLQELIDKINGLDGAYLGVEFDPKDLEALKDKLGEMKREIQERNPFKAFVNGLKDYSKAVDKESKKAALKNVFSSASDVMNLASGTLKAVTDGLKDLGVEMDAETDKVIEDIGGIMDGAGQVAMGIATGNPLAIIQGSISLLTSAIDLFNVKDRKARREIAKNEEDLNRLSDAYERLERAVSKALGTDVYKAQEQQIRNLEQQNALLQQQKQLEAGMKNPDEDAMGEYDKKMQENADTIEDIYAQMAEDILQTNAKSLASDFGDALVEAWERGEDGAKAFEETANAVIKNALINMLKKQFLEKQMQSALDGLAKSMGLNEDGTYNFDGLTEDEIATFKSAMEDAMVGFKEVYEAIFGAMPELAGGDTSSLTGAVKGVTEETASIVAGQMNAMRINQLEATQILRQSLQALNTIAANTQFNRHLIKIDRVISLLESQNNGRSQGLS